MSSKQMKPEHWRRIEALYHATLEREANERAAFLADACGGDEALRREVESLLSCDERAEVFIEEPALVLAAKLTPAWEDFKGTEQFLIQRKLGGGGFGVVYQAYDRMRNAVVALKILRQVDAAALYRFKREFRDLADITHPNLVTLYELFSDGEQWFFTMELVKGVDFLKYVRGNSFTDLSNASTVSLGSRPSSQEWASRKERGITDLSPFQLDRLREGLRQLAEGLCALHEAGKLHRDIKPSNVLVTYEGRVVLLDFGLITELSPGWLRQDTERQIVGTPAYMSPEQGTGLQVSEASDWYSLGVVLYEALTGRLPFSGPLHQMILDKQEFEPLAPSELVSAIPEDLDTLCRSLLSRDPQARPSGREALRCLGGAHAASSIPLVAPSSLTRAAPFVGRERHLAALKDAFRATREGQAVIVRLHGSSGIGKSALALCFLEELQSREEVVVLQGRCYEQESVPYKGFDSVVDDLSQYLKRLPPQVAGTLIPDDFPALTRIFPVLRGVEIMMARRIDVDIPDAQELRKRAFAALRDILSRLAARKPLVLFIDDLQWGDIDSAALLTELLYPPDPPPLLLIACHRSEETETSPFLKKLLSLEAAITPPLYISELEVSRLDPSEARNLTLTLLGRKGRARISHAEAIARESEGNPFFINELVRYSQFDAGPMQVEEMVTQHESNILTGELRLDKVIRDRIAHLPEEARRLLEVVAVAGQPLRMEIAKRASDLGSREQPALTLLRSAHMVRSRETGEQGEIEVYHDRIRETVVDCISLEVLKNHHHHLAVAMQSSSQFDPETITMHFRGAEEYEKASDYAAIAAAQASETLAFDRAARLYQLALELRPLPPAETRSLRVKLGEALANAGRGAEAGRIYHTAAEGASAAESVELQRRAAEQLLISGHMDEGLSIIANVLKAAGMKLTPTARRALIPLLLLRARIRLRGLGFRAREAAQISAEELIRIDTCWSVTKGLSMVDPMRAAEYQARHLLLALWSGEKYQIARALAFEASYHAISGGRKRNRTQEVLQMAIELSQSIDNPHSTGLTTLVAGAAAFLEGRWRESRELLERAERALRERCTGVAWELATARLMWCVSLFFLGELGELGQLLPNLLKNADGRGDLYEATDLRIRISHAMLLAADDPGKARQEVRQALTHWPSSKFYAQHWWGLIAEVEIALYSERVREAWDLITKQWPALSGSLLLNVQYILIESLHHRARCALAMTADNGLKIADRERLLRSAERDARRIEREGMYWGGPLAQLIHATIVSIRGDVEEAAARLNSAEAGFEAAGMSLYAAAARRRRGELIGGDQGQALITIADAWMTSQQIKNPSRMTAMLAPGWQLSSVKSPS